MNDVQEPKFKLKKYLLWLLLAPIGLFLTLVVLLYVPPVQNFVCGKAMSVVSESLGMDITIGRVDLRFPLNLLAHDVQVIQEKDTLLDIGTLNVRVKAWPLFRGKIDVGKLELTNARLNSARLIDGVLVKALVGKLSLISNDVDLNVLEAYINDVSLSNAQVFVAYADTLPVDDQSEPLNWKIHVDDIFFF